MRKFLKKSFLDFAEYLVSTYGAIVAILIFAGLAITYWEEYAWGSTAIFVLFVFVALGFYHFRKK